MLPNMNTRLSGLLTALLIIASMSLLPASASAASCDDYATQAEAQKAADTVDADGDGRFCESLPCPCAKSGDSKSSKSPAKSKRKTKAKAKSFDGRISAVVDGDTLKVRRSSGGRVETVRILGIDTPETKRPGVSVECGGPEATSHMYGLTYSSPRDRDGDGLFDAPGGDGRMVTLKTDPTQDERDRYGRLLAYVTTRTDADLGLLQIRAGWAARYVFGGKPVQRDAAYRKAERKAKGDGEGAWRQCGGDFHSEQ